MKRPQDLFRDVMASNPRGSRKEHRDELWSIIKDSERLLEDVFDQWFDRRYSSRVVIETPNGTVFNEGQNVIAPPKSGHTPGPEPETDYAAERKKAADKKRKLAKRAAELATQFAKRVLLDWLLPDGTMLRDAGASKCIRAGGWIALVGKRLQKAGGGKVGTRFSEKQLHNLWQQANGSTT